MTLTGALQIDLNSRDYDFLRRSKKDNPPISLAVMFTRPFATPPAILLGLSGFHGGGEGHSYRFEPSNVTEAGFTVLLFCNRNWVDALEISWLATDA